MIKYILITFFSLIIMQVKSQNFIAKNWEGTYYSAFEIIREMEEYNFDFTFKVKDENNVSLELIINSSSSLLTDLHIDTKHSSEVKLILKSNTDKDLEYIISKKNKTYNLSGLSIYLLNPLNNEYKAIKLNSEQTIISQENKVAEINYDSKDYNWVFNPQLIGSKIEGNLQKSALIHLLQDAFARGTELAYNFDIFNSDNLELLSFYDYPKFHFGDIDFNAFYAKIEYEDANYELVLVTNSDKKEDYKSLIVYENLDSEVMYSRLSKMNFPIIESSFIYQGKETKSQQFIVENGLFLDYFADETPKNEFWNVEWGANIYTQETMNPNQAKYQSTGKITNHLKTGIWKEKRYSIEYKSPILITGNYDKGLKQGAFSIAIPFPDFEKTLIYSGNYENGMRKGSWNLTLKDSLIIENKLNPTSYSEIFHLKTDTKKINKENSLSIPDKWYGFYKLESAKIDLVTNKINKFTFYVNIVKDHIYVNVDAANLVDFWCEGEYFITDYSENFIYCKGICDENSFYDIQLRTENGLSYIKSDFFEWKDWMLIKKE